MFADTKAFAVAVPGKQRGGVDPRANIWRVFS
jgi:hypothetical protein